MKKQRDVERCVVCGDPTGRAGGGDDSMYFGDEGPLCAGCLDFMESKYNQPWPKSKAVKK